MISRAMSASSYSGWGGERIYRDGRCAGHTTSGAYGHSVGGAVALGYVHHAEPITADFIKSGRFAVDVAGVRCPARATPTPPYNPKDERIKG